jgi:hypothetical protein
MPPNPIVKAFAGSTGRAQTQDQCHRKTAIRWGGGFGHRPTPVPFPLGAPCELWRRR